MTSSTAIRRLAGPTLALLTAACGTSAWAGPKTVPFKASAVTQEALTFETAPPFNCPGSFVVGTTTGKGIATHLGLVSLSATDCPLTLDGMNYFFNNGRLTLTAANGDTLSALYSGSLLPIAGSIPVLHAISGTYAVTGGTGRFAGARGAGNLQGTENLATFKGLYQMTGTLTYGSHGDRD